MPRAMRRAACDAELTVSASRRRTSARLAGRAAGERPRASIRILELQPELQEAICAHLSLDDISALASTSRAAASLHTMRITFRVHALRQLTYSSRHYLLQLIGRLPDCPARTQILEMFESAVHAFQRVCSCNEAFLQLSNVASMRGLGSFSPVQAAEHARCCCATCDHVSVALVAVSVRLNDFVMLALSSAEHLRSLQVMHEDGEPAADAREGVEPPTANGATPPPPPLLLPPIPQLPAAPRA